MATVTGLGLVLHLFGWPIDLSTLGGLVVLGVFVAAWVPAWAMRGQWLAEVRKLAAETHTREISNAERLAALAVPVVMPETDADAEELAWQLALETFFLAGQKAGGFSVDKLAGCVGSDAWARLTEFYSSAAGLNVLRVAPGNVGTVWGHAWGLDRAMQALRAGKLPFPTGPVPDVRPFPDGATQRKAPRRARTQADDEPGPAGVPAGRMVVDG